jgi:hypothetical protein
MVADVRVQYDSDLLRQQENEVSHLHYAKRQCNAATTLLIGSIVGVQKSLCSNGPISPLSDKFIWHIPHCPAFHWLLEAT